MSKEKEQDIRTSAGRREDRPAVKERLSFDAEMKKTLLLTRQAKKIDIPLEGATTFRRMKRAINLEEGTESTCGLRSDRNKHTDEERGQERGVEPTALRSSWGNREDLVVPSTVTKKTSEKEDAEVCYASADWDRAAIDTGRNLGKKSKACPSARGEEDARQAKNGDRGAKSLGRGGYWKNPKLNLNSSLQ